MASLALSQLVKILTAITTGVPFDPLSQPAFAAFNSLIEINQKPISLFLDYSCIPPQTADETLVC